MYLALDTYVIRDPKCIGFSCSQPEALPTKLEIARQAGFEAVELWHHDVNRYIAKYSAADLREILIKNGLIVPSYKYICRWLESDETGYRQVREECLKIIATAASIKAQSCVVKVLGHEYRGPKPDRKLLLSRLRELLTAAEQANMTLGLEFMSDAKYYNDLPSVFEIIEEVNHPSAKLVLDTYHIWRRGDNDNFEGLARLFSDKLINPECISVVHFTDTSKWIPRFLQRDDSRRLPGEGRLNLSKFYSLMNDIKYKGALSLNVYDQSLWNYPPLQVATKGYYGMHRTMENPSYSNLADGLAWQNNQNQRCAGLWIKDYWSHLDPRISPSDRDTQLKELLGPIIKDKKVLDFKCGFSPLADFVSIGFDAYQGCITFLKKNYPNARWECATDDEFSENFNEQIDVLMHLGLGDSNSEVENHIKIREKSKPGIVILECCANADGTVNESKQGAQQRWQRLKSGLKGSEHLLRSTMSKRSHRLVFVGVPQEP